MRANVASMAVACAMLAWPQVSVADPDPSDPSLRPPLKSAGVPEPPPPKDQLFDGNYWGLHGGATYATRSAAIAGVADSGAGLRAGGRFSAILQLLDVDAALQYARFSGSANAVSRLDLSLTAALHPGFPLLVFNSWMYDVIAGLHGWAGADFGRWTVSGDEAAAAIGAKGGDYGQFGAALCFGAGADLPLSPRDGHAGWWLTVRYAMRLAKIGPAIPQHDFSDGQWQLWLGWRNYDNSWARVPRPF